MTKRPRQKPEQIITPIDTIPTGYISTDEAAKLLGVKRTAIMRAIQRGTIKGSKKIRVAVNVMLVPYVSRAEVLAYDRRRQHRTPKAPQVAELATSAKATEHATEHNTAEQSDIAEQVAETTTKETEQDE